MDDIVQKERNMNKYSSVKTIHLLCGEKTWTIYSFYSDVVIIIIDVIQLISRNYDWVEIQSVRENIPFHGVIYRRKMETSAHYSLWSELGP